MEDSVADSSADDTEESTAASEMTNSPKEIETQSDGTPTNNAQTDEGCKGADKLIFFFLLCSKLTQNLSIFTSSLWESHFHCRMSSLMFLWV